MHDDHRLSIRWMHSSSISEGVKNATVSGDPQLCLMQSSIIIIELCNHITIFKFFLQHPIRVCACDTKTLTRTKMHFFTWGVGGMELWEPFMFTLLPREPSPVLKWDFFSGQLARVTSKLQYLLTVEKERRSCALFLMKLYAAVSFTIFCWCHLLYALKIRPKNFPLQSHCFFKYVLLKIITLQIWIMIQVSELVQMDTALQF